MRINYKINKISNGMKKFFKKPIIIITLVFILAGIFFIYRHFSKNSEPQYEFTTAQRGNLYKEVSVTGRVEPSESVDLAFEKSGKVVLINTETGKKVSAGQILVKLDNADLFAQLDQAEADVKAQQAKLEELKRGTRPEEINLQEIKVKNAKSSLEDAQKNLIDKIQDAYTKSDDAIRNKTDQLFSNPNSSDPKINITVIDSQLKIDIEQGRFLAGIDLNNWKLYLNILSISSDLDQYIKEAKDNLDKVKSLLDKVALAVNSLTSSSSLSQTTIDSYKSDISTARTNINTAISNLSSAEEKLETAKSTLSVEENQLFLLKAGTIQEQIKAQEAQVEKSEASAKNTIVQIGKTILYSPINGVVTKQDAKVGEIISANENIISIISENNFEIKANIPETDIAKIKIDNQAKITLDAYGDDIIFKSHVSSIDPGETIIEGVSTYRVILQFDNGDEHIKSGMTANIDIMTDSRESVIFVPQRAVASKNGDKIVQILDGDNVKDIKVKVGLRDSSGNIEIIEGLNEGDKIIVFIKE